MRVAAMLALVGVAGAAIPVRAMPAPSTIVSDDEADPVRSAITRKEAWTLEAARRLRLDADRRMVLGPWSVTTDRPNGIPLDSHDYYSEAPYYWANPDDPSGPYILHEGRLNPDRFNANRTALNLMCDTVFALGTAAYLFDDSRYAQRAARVIQTWFLNPKSRMNPNLEYAGAIRGLNTGRAAGLLEGRVFIRAIQGMEFLARTGNWDMRDQEGVRKWFQDYLQWLTQGKNGLEAKASGNNQASWWTAQVAAVATFVENDATTKMAFNYYRDRIFPRQIAPDGSAPREEARTSLWYSVFNLEAFTLVCRIAEVQGTDLWSVRGKNGSNLASVIDYLKPTLSDTRKWSREQALDLDTDALYFLAFAGMGLKKPEYISLYQKLEHPERAWLSFVDLLVGRWEAAGHQTRH
ncbi:MAG: alginate lyase family protein [Acidobacteriia bacterium]|nr:alginate lyase family protein [Terriglobia bacterium]